jgi:DNA-binding SARP family transcriptional activator
LTGRGRPQRRRARSVEVARAFAALLVLATLVGGIPIVLWRLGGWPLPHSLPSLAELRVAITRPLPDDVIANTLVTLAWAWWAHFLVCLVAETVSAARGHLPVRIPGGWLSQAIAARLIGAMLFLTPSANFIQPSALAAPHPMTAVTAAASSTSRPFAAQQRPEQALAEEHPVLKRYIVQAKQPGQPHDTLWGIAERHLGDPLRWPEIWELNHGRPLPDPPGGRFTDKDRIWPGQELLLPTDAVRMPPNQHPEDRLSPTPQPTEPQPPREQPAPPPSQTRPSTPATPSTTSAAQPTPPPEPPPASTPTPDSEHGGQLLRIVTGLAGAGLLAVGVIAMLTRLRRRQQRARRSGRRIPLPTGAVADVEVGLRRTQEPDAARFLDLALRTLAYAVRQAGLPPPEVLAVLLAPEQLEVRLADPSDAAPPPFERAAPDRWRLARATPTDQLEQAAAEAVAPLPALVTAGMVEDTRVLLNLEAPGMVALAGDPIGARALLDACAVELATSVWSDYLDLILVGFGEELGPLERVRHAATLEEILPVLERRAQRARQLLDAEGHPSALSARMISRTPDSWTLTVVLCASPPSPAALARLFPTDDEPHGLPLAILAVGKLPPPAWRVELAGGHATIDALDLTVRSLQLTPEAYQAIVKLLSTAASAQDVEPDTPPYDTLHRPAPAAATGVEVIGHDPAPAGPTTLDPAPVAEERLAPAVPIEVCVLGRIELRGIPRIQRAKALELIVYLALHPAGVDLERLWEALWPERSLNRPTLHSAASVARAHLGDAPDGTPYLPLAREGLYRLSPLISLDWTRFQTLTQLAARDDSRAIPALRQALDLVRGIPLEGATPGDYEWAFAHRTEMESAIGDAAEQLARHYLDQGNHTDAIWAARRGLLASPYDERLYRQLMRSAYDAGNPSGVDAIMRELLHVLDAEAEPIDDLHPETVELYKKLRGTRLLRT